jgi:dimeric dUTPase (all-alpha-NTP-PPase superfamily)
MLDQGVVSGFPAFDPTAFEDVVDPTELETMLNLQRMLMSACEIDKLPVDIAFWVTGTALVGEANEALENFQDLTKPWKRNTTVNLPAVQEEAIDVLFFLLQWFVLLGMTSDDILKMYKDKSTVNFQRIMEKMRKIQEME